MKEKIRNIIVIEGTDLMLGGTIFILLLNTFLKDYIKYLPIVICLTVIGVIGYIYSLLYCIIHCAKNSEFDRGKKIIKIALLIIFSLFYIPIYYTKYVMKKKKWIGIVECIVYILAYFIIFGLLGVLYINGLDKTNYSKDKNIEVKLKSSWVCYNEDIGDQKLYCFNLLDKGSFGVFTYDTVVDDYEDVLDLMKYHSEQLNKGYLKEGFSVIKSNKDNDCYVTELEKEGQKFYTITRVKTTDKKTYVVAYSGFDKDVFYKVEKEIKYKG